jgi:hypothetical protein
VASKSLVKWLKMLWENWGACVCGVSYVVCCSLSCVVRCVFCCALSPAAGEFTFLLQAKERANYKHAALFSYMGKHGVQRRRVGGRLDVPCRDVAIMAYLVPE